MADRGSYRDRGLGSVLRASQDVRLATLRAVVFAHVVLAGARGITFADLADVLSPRFAKREIDPVLDWHQREGRVRRVAQIGLRGRWLVTDEGRAVHERLMSAQVTT